MTQALRPRRWLAPEVVQTSSMDCGPAVLQSVLAGHRIPASYGRLREACQTDVDGTSIDTIEAVCNQLGVAAEQHLLPLDHVFHGPAALPAVMVVHQGDGTPHFIVVWRRLGPWLQVMDPEVGRRWVRRERLAAELLRHRQSVASVDWRRWAGSPDFVDTLRARLFALGCPPVGVTALLQRAHEDGGWLSFATLDAAARLVQSLIAAGGLARGEPALRLVRSLFERALADPVQRHDLLPRDYWSVLPVGGGAVAEQLTLCGAVLLRLGRGADTTIADAAAQADAATPAALSPALAAAVLERTPHPMRLAWSLLRQDGLLAPLALAAAMGLAVAAALLEALMFRGVFDLGHWLGGPDQRFLAALALLGFIALVLALQWPIGSETLRLGRHLELRMRMALLRKLPRLEDRYFQSRPVSDMVERSHAIQALRQLPALGLQAVQTVCELLLTLAGVVWLAPQSAPIALAAALLPMLAALLAQSLLNERELRARHHARALDVFYLDTLLGAVPIRAHGAQAVIRRQHEGLMTEWARAHLHWMRLGQRTGALLSLTSTLLVTWLLAAHFMRQGEVLGSDLLLLFWALKLPALGSAMSGLMLRYPGLRNVLLRVQEPLTAPEGLSATLPPAPERQACTTAPAAMALRGGRVVAAGHTLLQGVDLSITAGEHVAIVGSSGAGKSTLMGVLLGWHRLAEGTLQVDGAPLDAPALDALRRTTAWVDPGVQLWNASFLDNLGYASGNPALERIGPAIDAATLRDVLRKLPEGLQTLLGEGGGLISGGEGQRLRLARALLQEHPRLVLLDEPFRGIDRSHRATLLATSRQWWADATLLCVTHDVGETLGFPRVLVVESGRIVEDGVPVDLARRDSRYRELLQAEQAVLAHRWTRADWRRLQLVDGRLQESGPQEGAR